MTLLSPTEAVFTQAVAAQFADRPTLRTVVAQLLSDGLRVHYPTLSTAPNHLRVAMPRDGGGRDLKPLPDLALEYLANASFPDLSPRQGQDCFLSDPSGTRMTYQAVTTKEYDLHVIEGIIRELPSLVPIAFQNALAQFWGEPGEPDVSRLAWLSGLLRSNLRVAAIRQSGDDAIQLRSLTILTDCPDRKTRAALPWPDNGVHAYTLEAQLTSPGRSSILQACDILMATADRVWLYRLPGTIEPYANLDECANAWAERVLQRYPAETLTWRQYEPDGVIFDHQAALVLNRQLEDLAALQLPANGSVAQLQQHFTAVTDPTVLFADAPVAPPVAQVELKLPQWLKQASAADRFAYRQCLLEEASFRRLANGDGYLNDLHNLEDFANMALNTELCLGRLKAHNEKSPTPLRACANRTMSSLYNANRVQLTFHVPVGTLGGGYIEPVRMTLVELALKNLSGKPKGTMTVAYNGRPALEDWITPQFLLEVVQRVNIGETYPAYIREHLMGDRPEAQRRQRLFSQQRPIQLATLALEYKIRGLHGLTLRGFQCVKAVVQATRAQRWVQGDEIVMRPLAFVRKPEAAADVVQNMFIIEPRHTGAGPHLLYRPSYADSLLEFASREALLAAIAQPGAVQDSVLTWLPDHARPIYSNGGFHEPHYVRVVFGSEFDMLPSVPKPAALAAPDDSSADELLQSLSTGKLMEYLYGSEVCSLLDQAQRDSTSNTESRWALILEGLQLGFNTLLALVRGPLAAVGWLMQLALSLKQDIPALESDDPRTRELAWIDLLLNVGMLLLHLGQGTTLPRRSATPLQAAHGRPTTIRRGTAGVVSQPPGAGSTLLDFERTLAGDWASASALEKLVSISQPWPNPLPEQIQTGEFQGLYKIGTQWHASVGGLFFRVNIVPGFGEVFIIHPQKTEHPGIKLRALGNGRWILDRGIKLVGGGDSKRIQAQRQKIQDKKNQLATRALELLAEVSPLMDEVDASRQRLDVAAKEMRQKINDLTRVQDLLENVKDDRRAFVEQWHARAMLSRQNARTQFRILLKTLQERLSEPQRLRNELVDVQKTMGEMGESVPRGEEVLETTWLEQNQLRNTLSDWNYDLSISERGEPMTKLVRHMRSDRLMNNPAPYEEHQSKALEIFETLNRMVDISRSMEALLDQLDKYSNGGRVLRKKLLEGINPQYFFAENVRIRSTAALQLISLDTDPPSPSVQELLYLDSLNKLALTKALSTHIEVRSSNEYPLKEQRKVYETLISKYRSYEGTIRAFQSMGSKSLSPAYTERFLKQLNHVRVLAEHELETVVRAQEQLEVKLPLSKTLKPKKPTKQIFKTGKNEYLIGEAQPRTRQDATDRMIITDTVSGDTISTYEPGEDGWNDTTAPLDLPPMPLEETSLPTLRDHGNELIRQRADLETLVHNQQTELDNPLTREDVNPEEWDTLLTRHANKLEATADALQQHHPDSQTATHLITEYRAHARDITRWAEQVCSEGYKRQRPTLEGLDYLWRHKQIDINLTSAADPNRPTLSGDFFTEYAVYDKAQKPPTVLWYAHFHYASANAEPSTYTRAHLKLPEQRKYTQKDLLKQHVQADLLKGKEPGAEPISKIVYVLITPPQDQLFLAITLRQRS